MAAAALLLCFLSLATPSASISEADALLKLKQSFTQAQALQSWNDNTSPCTRGAQWRGVVCMNGIVTGIHLTSMDIAGVIDVDALAQIRGLRTISLSNNSFSGPMPPFNRLGALKALYLSSNEFSGDIPPDFFSKMNSLKRIWLSGNGFTGRIPDSIGKLTHLRELHLENNKFSGAIPEFPHNKLASADFSNNELEGEIPESLWKFKAESFKGNPNLCGKLLNKECPPPTPPPAASPIANAPPPGKSKMSTGAIAAVVLLIMISLVVFATIMNRRRDDDFDVLAKESQEEVVEVHVAGSTARYSRKSSGSRSSRRGSGKNVMGDLVMVNEEQAVFGLADLMKASAEVLGNGGLGSAYKAVMGNGISVVVKRMREMNRLGRDGFDAEMRRIGSLHHPNILTPLAYHYRKEEKLLVSEYVPKGSLLYVLHGDRGSSHTELTWATRLKIMKGIAQGLDYLHTEFGASADVPHGNLKSSNVLLDGDWEPLLSDYAFYPLINTSQAAQALFALKSPEYVQHQKVHPKSDVYCLGIITLEVVTGKFPSQYLTNGKGGTDIVHWVHSAIADHREVELIDPEIAESASESDLDDMQKLLHIGAACTETNPDERPSIREVIRMVQDLLI